MPPPPDMHAHLASLVGRDVLTISGRRNTILRVTERHVFVRTAATRSADGAAVDIGEVARAAERLWRDGELRIDTHTLGHHARSAFIGAILGTIPGVRLEHRPARALLVDPRRPRRSKARADRWWATRAEERFWLEVSQRASFGEDLHAPADSRTSHALVMEVRTGDIVFHYSKHRRAIIGWSEVAGAPRKVAGEYRAKLSGMLGVTNVTLDRLRDFDSVVREVALDMDRRGHELHGFPFERSASRPIRPLSAYLAKLPRRIVEVIPELAEAAELDPRGARRANRPARLDDRAREADAIGSAYRPADEAVTIPLLPSQESEAWRVELAAMRTARSTREHNRLQNNLERLLKSRGTRSPVRGDGVLFDLAWQQDERLAFAEIKSLPAARESQRLRLGLGQCLFYRHVLQLHTGTPVAAHLVIPRQPRDPRWRAVCAAVGVTLTWPPDFAGILAA
jgi:hypothetical protein